MREYDQFLDTLQELYNFDDSEKVFRTLNIVAELLLQVKDNRLSGATYQNEFIHDRVKIKVTVEKRNPNG